ncbi:MAG: hypothetical protein P8M30_05335 [Planctomycetaceae bacterium]|nr:hypothetical protein [Planctomycetaceae bacterium]
MNALDSLASFNEMPSETPTFSESAKDEQPDSPKPVVIPEPLELPPFGQPVILSEPPSPSVANVLPESAAKESSESGSDNPEDPFAKLAALSPAPLQESPVKSQITSGVSRNSDHPPVIVKHGITLPVVAIMTIIAFGLGFLLGGRQETTELATNQQSTETEQSTASSSPAVDKQTDLVPQTQTSHEAIEGRISYRTVDGNTRPDEGAVVIFLPAYRKSSARLPIVGFRPADSTEDRTIARAAIRALGGDLVKVGEDGLYSSTLPQAGEYHVIVLSRHATRPEEAVISTSDRSTLGEYFDRPQQLLGQLAYHVGNVTYRGEKTEIWDHAFEAS